MLDDLPNRDTSPFVLASECLKEVDSKGNEKEQSAFFRIVRQSRSIPPNVTVKINDEGKEQVTMNYDMAESPNHD